MVIVKHLWIPKKYWIYVPNWNAVGLVRSRPSRMLSLAETHLFRRAAGLRRSPDSILDRDGGRIAVQLLLGEAEPGRVRHVHVLCRGK